MSASINIGFSCRDIGLLGADDQEVTTFIMDHVVPAFMNEITSRRQLYFGGFGTVTRAEISPEITARGCSVGGTITINI